MADEDLRAQVADTAATVTLDGISLPIRAYGDGRWYIDLGLGEHLLSSCVRQPPRSTPMLHRDREAAVTAATMLCAELRAAHTVHDRAVTRAQTALMAYAIAPIAVDA